MTRVILPLFLAGMAQAATAQQEISLWYHGAENETEKAVLEATIAGFNASQSDAVVVLESLPEFAYNDAVEAAALSGNLPCIIDVDGPIMPRWAWAGFLQPLPIEDAVIADFLDGTKGYYNGTLYSIGLWDAAVAMVTRKSTLDTYGIRVPTLDAPWTTAEFDAALATLKASGDFDYPLDLGMAWTGEWYPYAFSPFLQSFGGDIIDRSTYQTAQGVLNGPEALAFGEWWQGLFAKGYAEGPGQEGAARNTGFVEGRYAISYNGNWAALGALEAFGDDTLFLPNVDHGNGPTIGAASWQFGVSSFCADPAAAADFITFALQDQYVASFSDNLGLIPSTTSAALISEYYSEGAAMEVFYELSAKQSFVRPVTPAYLNAARVFESAVSKIAKGEDVAASLDAAVAAIDTDIAQNGDYLNAKRCNQIVQIDGRWALQSCSKAGD